VIGKDGSGERLLKLVENAGFPYEGLLEDASRPTTIKTRVIAHSTSCAPTVNRAAISRQSCKKLC
jgi:bifunctional ADP-heptose synthase (sugar kinase/adenylyltransferase)